MQPANLFTHIGLTLIFVGIAIIIVAIILFMLRGAEEAEKVRGGGIIFIGPFPIIFGTDRESFKFLILLAIIIIIAVTGLILGLSMLKT